MKDLIEKYFLFINEQKPGASEAIQEIAISSEDKNLNKTINLNYKEKIKKRVDIDFKGKDSIYFIIGLIVISLFFIFSMKSLSNNISKCLQSYDLDDLLKFIVLLVVTRMAHYLTYYWGERKVYADKWNYASNMYNKIFEIRRGESQNDIEIIHIKTILLNSSLAIDLLTLRLQNDPAFSKTFLIMTKLAFFHTYKENYLNELNRSLEGSIDIKNLHSMLANLQNDLYCAYLKHETVSSSPRRKRSKKGS